MILDEEALKALNTLVQLTHTWAASVPGLAKFRPAFHALPRITDEDTLLLAFLLCASVKSAAHDLPQAEMDVAFAMNLQLNMKHSAELQAGRASWYRLAETFDL